MLKRNGIGIGISNFPFRKKPCLFVQKGNCAIKVASFNNEEAAKWFQEIVMEFFDGLVNEKEGEE